MESNIPNAKTFVVPKGPITLLMTKNGPIMIITNNNQLPSFKVPNKTQQTPENTESLPRVVTNKPISKTTVPKQQSNVNKVGTKEVVKILTAAETERIKSIRAKRLIDSLQQNETAGTEIFTETDRIKSKGENRVIDSYQQIETAGNILTAAETERNKSMRAKRLIDSLQQIETAGNEKSNVIYPSHSGVQWVKRPRGAQQPEQESNQDMTVMESEIESKEKSNYNSIGSHLGFQNKNRSYACHKCGQKFEKLDSMMKHFPTHRNEKLSTPSAKRIRASPKNSTKKNAKHKQPTKELNCFKCEYKCKESESMEIHMKIHSEVIEKPFSCDTCGERFTLNSELMEHIKMHTGEKIFSCSTCGWKFTQKHSLLSHLLSHNGEKHFSCTKCEKKFATEALLKRHKAKHVEGETECPICSKTFKTILATKKHVKLHDIEEGRYICGICEMAFHNKSKLIHHLSQHTDNEPVEVFEEFEESFLCPFCEEIFIHRDDLIQHFEDMHV